MDTQARSDDHYNAGAADYERDADHAMPSNQREAWDRDIDPIVQRWFLPDAPVLDVGAGTGVLTKFVAEKGFVVHGIDSSSGMIDVARDHLDDLISAGGVTLTVADTHTAALAPGSYGAVVSRQVVCHLVDPLAAFRRWHEWLRPGGVVMAIDAFWLREDWSGDGFGADIDILPLCCVQNMGPLAYLLEQAGFVVEHRSPLDNVNGWEELSRDRYVVVARKTLSCDGSLRFR